MTVPQLCQKQWTPGYPVDQHHSIYDNNNNTCVRVPYGEHPWSLRIHIHGACVNIGQEYTFNVHIVGKELSCTDDYLLVGFNVHEKPADAASRKFELCHVDHEAKDNLTALVTCLAICDRAFRLPETIFLDVKGRNKELCELYI